MQDAVAPRRPTLAVHLPHTLDDTMQTWREAWPRFEERGGQLRSATSAIRHLDRYWNPHSSPVDERLLAGTGRGQRGHRHHRVGGGRRERSTLANRTMIGAFAARLPTLGRAGGRPQTGWRLQSVLIERVDAARILSTFCRSKPEHPIRT
jgi:hypothetical protein